MLLQVDDCQLVLVDFQARLMPAIHEGELALAYDRLAAAGCELVSTEMVGFEWLVDAEHPQFRAWQAMIR